MTKTNETKFDITFWIPTGIAIVALILTPFLTYYFGVLTQQRIDDRQRLYQAYSSILGERAVLQQFYVTSIDAGINFDYYQRRWILDGIPKDSILISQMDQLLAQMPQLHVELAKSKRTLFEGLGVILAAFPKDEKINALINQIMEMNAPAVLGDTTKMTLPELEVWKTKAKRELGVFIQEKYGAPIVELSGLVREKLQ